MLVDPLIVDEWEPLDSLIAGRPVAVVHTIRWHKRSRDEVAARYRAAEPRGIEQREDRGPPLRAQSRQ